MKQHRKSKIESALKVLGLSEPLREADIIDAMNRIRQSWEDVQSPKAWEAKRNAQEAGIYLLHVLEATELAAETNHAVDPLLYFVNEETVLKVRKSEQLKRRKILIGSALLLAVILAFGIPNAIQNRRESMIESVLRLRSTMNPNNYMALDLYLSKLGNEPRVETVRADYDLIREDLRIWMRPDASTSLTERRNAYYRLVAFDDAKASWYLMGLLDLKGDYIPLIADSRFESDELFFELTIDASNTKHLETNLPAVFDSQKPYVLQITANGRDYRMVHQSNDQDIVNLYRIHDVSKTQLTIYCYANARVYVLNRIDS